MTKGRAPGWRSGPAEREGRETSKEAADLLTTKPAEPPTAHPPRPPRKGALLADSESRRPAGRPGRRRGHLHRALQRTVGPLPQSDAVYR